MQQHPLRERLIHDLHARPFITLAAPLTLLHLAMVHGDGDLGDARDRLAAICRQHGVDLPDGAGNHVSVLIGDTRLKWEHHAEFTTWTLWRTRAHGAPFAARVGDALEVSWLLEALPGELLTAVRMEVLGADDAPIGDDRLAAIFDPASLCGSSIGEDATRVWSDFRADADGCLRFLVHERAGDARQLGRRLQRLLEMETYRCMAMLGLPLAQATAPTLSQAERRLQKVTQQLEILADLDAEKALLAELMKLAAESEERVADTAYRFSASRAYFDIVGARLRSLPEATLGELPTLSGFIARRLAPAMATCESTRQRQDALAARITRAANLLRTRVDLALESQNRDLLASMERRARTQLRLQQTVEGLSVAAITYYVVGLVGYLAKALRTAGIPLSAELATGFAVPVVALAVWCGLRRFRRRIEREERPAGGP